MNDFEFDIDLSIEDTREIEMFRTWLAKIDILEKSGEDRTAAMLIAYREVYASEPVITDIDFVPNDTNCPEKTEKGR